MFFTVRAKEGMPEVSVPPNILYLDLVCIWLLWIQRIQVLDTMTLLTVVHLNDDQYDPFWYEAEKEVFCFIWKLKGDLKKNAWTNRISSNAVIYGGLLLTYKGCIQCFLEKLGNGQVSKTYASK